MRLALIAAIAALSSTASADREPFPPAAFSAAIAGGLGQNGLPIDGSGYSNWTTDYVLDVEGGVRFERVGFALFGRWAHTPRNTLYNDGPGQWSVHMNDFDIGVRLHVWPVRHRLRLSAGIGGTIHHETDSNLAPTYAGEYDYNAKLSTSSLFLQAQVAVVVYRLPHADLEVGGDVASATYGSPAIALTLGARL